ncbi:MAG: 6,7-dimethyl-8-ribityllumazine synthase [Nitrosomonas sp.]|jgi:6,7-dimethyl-8-ribityllumazine synthase|nr:6,7-dimethyl-8-ribityllumazine synthase [Nitrosomonas sp.]MCC7136144.1 6,7-dimethyl-8-ribityllumazine synthase [Nitrosomonas sp.]
MAYYDNIPELETELDGRGLSIGIVMSRFNLDIAEGLLSACTAELIKLGVNESDMMLVTVPGALEAPPALQKLAITDRFDALIALGAVIRGETYHFEIVANESARGLMIVGLDYDIPIANGILTTSTDDEAIARMTQKGTEVARVAVEMAITISKLDDINIDDQE